MLLDFQSQSNFWLQDSIQRGRSGVHAQMVRLTPVLASELLQRNPDNRSIQARRVEVYASDIVSGRWAANGEPIILSKDGLLNDGQHRCAAVIQANMPIDCLIVFGIDRETRTTTNQGKAKGTSDYAAMYGIPNANNVAAMARFAVAYYEIGSVETTKVSHSRALEYLNQNTESLLKSFRFIDRYRKKFATLAPPSFMGFCHYVCANVNELEADDYFYHLCSGEGLEAGDPALVVRNRLMTIGRNRGAKIEVILRGWNHYRKGEQRSLIKVSGNIPMVS